MTLPKDVNLRSVHALTLFREGVSEHPIPGGDATLHHPAFLDNN